MSAGVFIVFEGGLPPREQVDRLGACSHLWALRPMPRGDFAGLVVPAPTVGLPGPHPGFLSFHDERNQRRAGAAPLDPGAWLPHFPRSLRFAPARAVLLPAFLPAALQARQHGGHIPPRLSPPPFGTLIACGFPFPYPGKKLLDARWGVRGVHSR